MQPPKAITRVHLLLCKPPVPVEKVVSPHGSSSLPWLDYLNMTKTSSEFYQKQIDYAINPNLLPKSSTDIRGVVAEGYIAIRRKQFKTGAQEILRGSSSKFIGITFYPADHPLGAIRKSNIAYMFNNYGPPMFNNKSIAQDFAKYNGNFKKSGDFFRTNHDPLRTAVARSKYRKLIKQLLFEAVNEVSDVNTLKGVYAFKFKAVPVTEDDKAELKELILAAVKLVRPNTSRFPSGEKEKLVRLIKRPRVSAYVNKNLIKLPFRNN